VQKENWNYEENDVPKKIQLVILEYPE